MKLIRKIEGPEIMAIYISGRERMSEERKWMDESWELQGPNCFVAPLPCQKHQKS